MEKQQLWIHGVLYELTPAKDILASQGRYTKTPEELEEERIAKLPKTWEDSIKVGTKIVLRHQFPGTTNYEYAETTISDSDAYGFNKDEILNNDLVVTNNEKYYNASVALSKLIWLRDIYNDNWKPDWNNKDEHKWVIVYADYFKVREQKLLASLLAFKSRKLAELFLENFIELIEKTKDLY